MPEKPQSDGALKVFYSYSHKDEKLRDTLEEHLSLLRRQGVISEWHDRRISAGREWAGKINEHLETADIVLLLVSSSFLASDYCYDVELDLALKRHGRGGARVIPVILRPCDWEGASFGGLQALPKNGRPVTKWSNRDDAFKDVANGIRLAAEELAAERCAGRSVSEDASGRERDEGSKRAAASLIPRPPVVGFVARRDEQGRDIVVLLKAELAPENNRLVALWGPGGSGKTTLAAEFARDIKELFSGHVAWVSALGRSEFSLATLLDEIATKLGREDLRKLAPDAKAAQVASLVSGSPTLVVLDNFETVSEEEQARCLDFFAQAVCPALVTTRYFINCDDVNNVPLAAMMMEEARDFLHRLIERTRKPSNFDRLDRDDLIRRCEANPLVLQWVVRQIDLAKRPQDVLDDLAHGEGDAAERVFTRSFNLPQLGDDGRTALLALSLFTPHASREALAEVSGFDDDMRRLNKMVESLSSLWLVEATERNERLFLRGLTRELAKSQLSKDIHADSLRRSYVTYFLRYAEAHVQVTPDDFDALETEKDNLLGAMDVASAASEWQSVMQISDALNEFLFLRGYWDEAIKSAEQGKAAAHETNDEWNIAAFGGNVALILSSRGEYEETKRIYLEGLEIFRKLEGGQRNVAASLSQLGIIVQKRGELKEARKFYGESLEVSKGIEDHVGIARALHQLGKVAYLQDELQEARRLFGESLKTARKVGAHHIIAYSLHSLATITLEGPKGRRQLFEESLDISNKLGDQYLIAHTMRSLGLIEEEEGNATEAARLFSEALRIFERLNAPEVEMTRNELLRVEGGAV